MKAVVAAFNQEKALVGAFSVITNLRMELFQALLNTRSLGHPTLGLTIHWTRDPGPAWLLQLLSAVGHSVLFCDSEVDSGGQFGIIENVNVIRRKYYALRHCLQIFN